MLADLTLDTQRSAPAPGVFLLRSTDTARVLSDSQDMKGSAEMIAEDGQMAQQKMELATKPDDKTSIPESHGGRRELTSPSCPLASTGHCGMGTPPRVSF